MRISPKVSVTLMEKKPKVADLDAPEEPKVDYVAVAEEATGRIGKKLVIGAVIVVAAHVVLTTAGTILTNALNNRSTTD